MKKTDIRKERRTSRFEKVVRRMVRKFLFLLALMPILVGITANARAQFFQTADYWIDSGLQDLASKPTPRLAQANKAFAEAVRLEPNNNQALALKTATSLLLVTQDPAIRKLLLDAGYTEQNAGAPTPQYIMPVDADGVFMPRAGAKTDQLLAYLNSRRSFIDAMLADLGRIKDPQFKLSLGSATGEGGATDMDYADVRALRAAMFFAKALVALGNSHNLRFEYKRIYDLYAQDRLNMRQLAERFPNLLKFADPAQRLNARRNLLRAENEIQAAISAFQLRTPLPQGRTFLFEIESNEEAQSAAEALAFFANALNRQVTIPPAPWAIAEFANQKLNLSPLFTSPSPLRSLLPTGYAPSGAFQRGTWPSPSLRGILPGLNADFLDKTAASLWFDINGESYFFVEPAIYRPYNFKTISSNAGWEWMLGGLAVDANGDTLVADNNDRTIKRITPSGVSSTVLTFSQIPGGDAVNWIYGLGVDASGRINFSDGYRVFRREVGGTVSSIAGTTDWSFSPRDGTGGAAVFANISSLTADTAGNVYVVDGDTSVRRISPTGQVTTLAGKAYTYDFVDGSGSNARFEGIRGSIGVDAAGNVWVTDAGRSIRKVATDGTTSTVIATPPGRDLHYDGLLSKATLYEPGGLTIDSEGNVFIADGNTIRKMTPDDLSTVGGRPHARGSRDGRGERARFRENWVRFLAAGKNGDLRLESSGRILSAEPAPAIKTHPVPVQVYRGAQTSFSVTPNAQNSTYQWLFKGAPMKDATNQSLSVLASDRTAGDYAVAVTDGQITEVSRPATLGLRPNASWSWRADSKSDQTREVGQALTLAVENVSGPAGLIRYQWFKDGRLLMGQTSRALTMPAVRLADSGAYELVITTSAGRESTGPRRLTVPDRGLLIYNLGGTGFAATAQENIGRRENGVVVVDRINQRSAFVWYSSDAPGKQFRVEYPENIAMHSTGPSPGTTSVLGRVMAAGTKPNIEKDVIWFTGADTWRRLTSKNGAAAEMLGPMRMKGSVHTLSLDDGVAIELLNASMTLDVAQTLRARSGSGETFGQAVQRIIDELAAKGYAQGL